MAITLAITDNENASGVATIAGSNVASSNTLYRTRWTGQEGAQTWTSTGSRTGDGAISLTSVTVGAGFWLWRLDNLLSGTITVVTNYQTITDTSVKSITERCLDSIVLRIQGLSLDGVLSASVGKKWVPRELNGQVDVVPGVIVCPLGDESFPGQTTAQDDIGIPVVVAVVDAQNQNTTANLTRNTIWRQTILSALRFQRLAGVPEVYRVDPEPAPTLDLTQWKDRNLFVAPLYFRCLTRTTRG